MFLSLFISMIGCASKTLPAGYNPLKSIDNDRHEECPVPMMMGKGNSKISPDHSRQQAQVSIASQINLKIKSSTIIKEHVLRIGELEQTNESIRFQLNETVEFDHAHLIKSVGDVIKGDDGNYLSVSCLHPRKAEAEIKRANSKQFSDFSTSVSESRKAEKSNDRQKFAREFANLQKAYPKILPIFSQMIALRGRSSDAMSLIGAFEGRYAAAKRFRTNTSFAINFDSSVSDGVLKTKTSQAFRNALQSMGINGDKSGSNCNASSKPTHVAKIKVKKHETYMMSNLCDLKIEASVIDCQNQDTFNFVIEDKGLRGANSYSKPKACQSAIKKLQSKSIINSLKNSLQYNIPL